MKLEMGLFEVSLELGDADFEAYAPERTRATTMTGPRAAVKRRLADWMRSVASALATEGIELDVSATDEHPTARNGHRVDAQSAFLFRTAARRRVMQLALTARDGDDERPELGSARLELRVNTSEITLMLWIGGDARVDLEHAAWVLAHEDLGVLWGAVPSALIEAHASLSSRAKVARDLTPVDAAAMARAALESEVPLVIGFREARAGATKGGLAGWFEHALALGRLLHAVSWTPESAIRASERPSRRGKRSPRVRAPSPAPFEMAKGTIERGAHVRALAGSCAGQVGVVQELDGKGGARVLFGLITARIELVDLTVHDSKTGRPRFSSSHRKPST